MFATDTQFRLAKGVRGVVQDLSQKYFCFVFLLTKETMQR
jgi:hypothetical protein